MLLRGAFLVVWWLGLQSLNTGDLGSVPGGVIESHMPLLGFQHTATKIEDPTCCHGTWWSQINEYIYFKKKKKRLLRETTIKKKKSLFSLKLLLRILIITWFSLHYIESLSESLHLSTKQSFASAEGLFCFLLREPSIGCVHPFWPRVELKTLSLQFCYL